MRNTFSPSVPNIICLPKPLRETLWRKGCRSKLPPLALSHSSPHAGSDRSGWWVDGRENDAGKKVRMTCEDMLWLPPWRDSAGLIMDGLVCWRGLNTKSLRWRRPSCLLATCIRCLLCFIAAGGYIGPGELALGFEPSFLTWEVNKQLQLMFYGCPILLSAGCQQKHPMRIMEPMLAERRNLFDRRTQQLPPTQDLQTIVWDVENMHIYFILDRAMRRLIQTLCFC